MNPRILIVEDDPALAHVLAGNLVFEGCTVECVADGHLALARARAVRPDLVLLDISIPGLDGFEVCRALTRERDRIPIIMLTAKTQLESKLLGLKLGADDYVTKPFVVDELLARIHAVLRRSRHPVDEIAFGDIRVDFTQMQAWKGGALMRLTSREFALLQYLAERAGKVVSRNELLRGVWGYEHLPVTRTVDNFMARLRRKLEEDPQHPRFLRTMYGDGYLLTVHPLPDETTAAE